MDVFVVRSYHKSGKIFLKIDLSNINPLFNGLSVSGNLNIVAKNYDKRSYTIGFKLVCTSTYCDQIEEAEDDTTSENEETETSEAKSETIKENYEVYRQSMELELG